MSTATKDGNQIIRESDDVLAAMEAEYIDRLARVRSGRAAIAEILRGTPVNGNGNGNGSAAEQPKAGARIGPEKLKRVENYLAQKRLATQVEMAKRLKMNSGSVSVALRLLAQEGRAKVADEQNERSQTWEIAER